MRYRKLGRTGWEVSEISFGAWAIGGGWGNVDDAESLAALHRALDLGVNFIDTADVYLQTLMQMGASRLTPVMATQVVPMVNAALPVVRNYRAALARFFDEPPTPQSLAGYIAAAYTGEILKTVAGLPTRQTTLQAFQQRQTVDMKGFRVSFNAKGRSGAYVTQTMVTADGRLIG